jgi:hypothetical protein
MYTRTSNVILAKCWLWLPDEGLYKPKHIICRHNIEYGYNKYTGTRIVILVKRWLWFPVDGLFKPKHIGAAFMILNVLIV